MRNKIKLFREKKKMSQRSLAEKVGMSQQHIQKIETGNQSIRLDFAIRICKVLENKLEIIFPESKIFLKKLPAASGQEFIKAITNKEVIAAADADAANIDVSPFNPFIKLGIKSFKESFLFQITSHDKNRLQSNFNDRTSKDYVPFFIFNTPTSTVILNLNQIAYCHFLLEYHHKEEKSYLLGVRVLLPSLQEELNFEVNADINGIEALSNRGLTDEDFENNQISTFMRGVEDTIEKGECIHFIDRDGEKIFLKAEEIGLMEIPLWVTHPEI